MAINLSSIGTTVEKYMLDTVKIERPGTPVISPLTLEETVPRTQIYNGKAFASPMGDPALTTVGGRQVYRTQYEIGIPHGSAQVQTNDIVTVLVTRAEHFVNKEMIVHESIEGTFHTHHRIKAWFDVEAT